MVFTEEPRRSGVTPPLPQRGAGPPRWPRPGAAAGSGATRRPRGGGASGRLGSCVLVALSRKLKIHPHELSCRFPEALAAQWGEAPGPAAILVPAPPKHHLSLRGATRDSAEFSHLPGSRLWCEECGLERCSTVITNALAIAVSTTFHEQLCAPAGPAVPVQVVTSSCHGSCVPPVPHPPGRTEGKTPAAV